MPLKSKRAKHLNLYRGPRVKKVDWKKLGKELVCQADIWVPGDKDPNDPGVVSLSSIEKVWGKPADKAGEETNGAFWRPKRLTSEIPQYKNQSKK